VLASASWNVGKDELKRLGASRGTKRFRTVQSWRSERRLPRLIVLADGDNQLPIDLSNTLSVESFVSLVKDRDGARLIEMFPGPDDLCARGPEGRFLHELIVPFVRTAVARADTPSVSSVEQKKRPPAAPALRSFLPGSEWLYAKLYTGVATADRLLLEIVAPLVKEALDSKAADRWFFIRYGDPDRHVRVRFHGVPERLWREVLPALHAVTGPLAIDGRLRKVQVETYEREIERYGGPEGIELAERFFQADSEAVLEILEMLEEGDAGADERWRLAFRGIDALIDDFGFAPPERLALLGSARREYGKEFRADENVKRGLGDRFRKESKSLELLLDPAHEEESPLAPGLAVLRRRSDRLAPLIRDLEACGRDGRLTQPLASIARSYVHMHVNRMLRSAQRAQEFVLYDFLSRVYESRAARARSRP
jgi:thiopeptide-type bacteriocin biosynthesis protein